MKNIQKSIDTVFTENKAKEIKVYYSVFQKIVRFCFII